MQHLLTFVGALIGAFLGTGVATVVMWKRWINQQKLAAFQMGYGSRQAGVFAAEPPFTRRGGQ